MSEYKNIDAVLGEKNSNSIELESEKILNKLDYHGYSRAVLMHKENFWQERELRKIGNGIEDIWTF